MIPPPDHFVCSPSSPNFVCEQAHERVLAHHSVPRPPAHTSHVPPSAELAAAPPSSQVLTESLRLKDEYFFDKLVADTFLENHFDSSHNTFETVRRVADIYEWGNQVLWPGIFSASGPHCGHVGSSFGFDSSLDWSPHTTAEALAAKGCNDDVWPDGEGVFHAQGATAWSVAEVVEWMNQLDWSEGISFRQTRVQGETDCPVGHYGRVCYPELTRKPREGKHDKSSFGYNWTHPNEPLQQPFTWLSSEELGGDPNGQLSASMASFRTGEQGGFVAVVIPFFSEVYRTEYRGPSSSVAPLKNISVTRFNNQTANYFCVRLSWNGLHVHQLCDPNDEHERTTGVVRAAVEDFWNDLKRAHFIDARTRSLVVTMPLRSNNIGVRSRSVLLFETTAVGGVLTSFDVETRVEVESQVQTSKRFTWVAFYYTAFFCILEGFELIKTGPSIYFSDMWNVMDWLNFAIFFLVFNELLVLFTHEDDAERYCATHRLCYEVGFFDDWRVMGTVRNAKLYLSLCVCIQLLKIIKFANQLVPKMGLATNVISRALVRNAAPCVKTKRQKRAKGWE